MPFVYINTFEKRPRNSFLPMLKTTKTQLNRERVSLFTSNKGSIVVETALVIPIFLTMFVMLLHFIIILDKQNTTCNSLYDNANIISKDILNYGTTDGVSIGYESILKDSLVLKSNASYKIPLLIWKGYSININQTLVCRKWTGESIVDNKEDNVDDNIVYITKNGKVYHTNKQCTHLRLSIKKLKNKEVKYRKNKYGRSYSKCKLCISMELDENQIIYITDMGDRYHVDGNCGGLTRFIQAISIKEIGERQLCLRCAS